jgi:hypothetical protein
MKFSIFIFNLLFSIAVFSTEYGVKEKKSFMLVKEHSFSYRTYNEITELPVFENALSGNEGPDREVANLLSALKEKDFGWWSGVVANKNLTPVELEAEFKLQMLKYGEHNFYYFDWSIVGQYVFVGIKSSVNIEEGAVDRLAFTLVDGRWKYLPLKEGNMILQNLNKELNNAQ